MRRVLSRAEYDAVLRNSTEAELIHASDVLAQTGKDLMEQEKLYRAALLCGAALYPLAKMTEERLAASGRQTVLFRLWEDELPDLADAVIYDFLYASTTDEALPAKQRNWIEAVNASGSPVISIVIPAGVGPETGRADDQAVRARATVALNAYLPGLFLHDGFDHCGRVVPVGGETTAAEGLVRFEEADAKRLLPPRKRTAHKGDSGRALLCVGSPKYVGAALLSARACLAAGCGILFVACPDVVRTALWRLPEVIGVPVGTDWQAQTCQIAIGAMEGMQALGIGCGVGNGDVSPLLHEALQSKRPMVLDADGLNCLARHPEIYPLLHRDVILTPHPGEMGRLTGLSAGEVAADPIGIARRYAERWGCTVLLKGAATVVSDGQRTCLLAEGNAGLGKGGSGDVLTGIVTALLAQGVEPFDAACLGSYLLGVSAEKAFETLGVRMLRATNVIEALEDIEQ